MPLRPSKVQLTLNSVPFVCACEWEPCGGQRWFKCLPPITAHLRLDGSLADLARLADKTIFLQGFWGWNSGSDAAAAAAST